MPHIARAYSHDTTDGIKSALAAAVREIFAVMLKERIELVPPASIHDAPRISSIIGFGGKISGVICLHFSKPSACSVAAGLLGVPVDAIDETVRDAVGELNNMIAGGLKKKLCAAEDLFRISLPSVIEGSEYSMHVPAGSRQVWLGVAAGACRFKIHLVMEQR